MATLNPSHRHLRSCAIIGMDCHRRDAFPPSSSVIATLLAGSSSPKQIVCLFLSHYLRYVDYEFAFCFCLTTPTTRRSIESSAHHFPRRRTIVGQRLSPLAAG